MLEEYQRRISVNTKRAWLPDESDEKSMVVNLMTAGGA